MPPKEDHCRKVVPSPHLPVGTLPKSNEKESKEFLLNNGGLFKKGKLAFWFIAGFLSGIILTDLFCINGAGEKNMGGNNKKLDDRGYVGGKRRAAFSCPQFSARSRSTVRLGGRRKRNVWPRFASDIERNMQTPLRNVSIHQQQKMQGILEKAHRCIWGLLGCEPFSRESL